MPVIVIGADGALGPAVADAVARPGRDVRAFVTDPGTAASLRERGLRVAIGDVSDTSHVAGAARGAYCAVVLAGCAADGRERSFASTGDEVVAGWAEALADAGVHRVIWVGDESPSPGPLAASVPEFAAVATVGRSGGEIAGEVARIDDMATLP